MNFLNYLKESAIDIPRNSLDPKVFTFNEGQAPVLKETIRAQILSDMDKLNQVVIVDNFYIIGSILSKRFTDNCDIDVNVEVFKEDVDDLSISRLLGLLKDLNGKLADGTQHPINYYVTSGEYDLTKTVAAYDPHNNRWIKEPKEFANNIQNYFNNFSATVSNIDLTAAELRRDIIDLEHLQRLSNEDISGLKEMIKEKIYEINSSIEYLIDIKGNFKKVRKYTYDRPMTPHEISQFSSKNVLPTEVTYKLLQKYYYWDFIQKLEEILGNDDRITANDIDQIKNAEKKFWGLNESNLRNTDAIARFEELSYAWISPHGNLYPCAYGEHYHILKQIDEARRNGIKDHDSAFSRGWFRLGIYRSPQMSLIEAEGLRSPFSSVIPYLKHIKHQLLIDRVDLISRDEYTNFLGFSRWEESREMFLEKMRDVRVKKVDFSKKRMSNSHSQSSARGTDRKSLGQVPQQVWQRHASWRNLGTSRKVITTAKDASSGIWRVTPQQVKEISAKYHFYPPNNIDRLKHLGNTGIILWRKTKGIFYLVKPSIKHKL